MQTLILTLKRELLNLYNVTQLFFKIVIPLRTNYMQRHNIPLPGQNKQ